VNDAYGCFSNFALYPIELDSLRWPTSEHYFQAQKFADMTQRERIRALTSPMSAARMGRSGQHPLREDWEQAKDEVMRTAVRTKFTQHVEIREVLLSTGDAEIVEHTKTTAIGAMAATAAAATCSAASSWTSARSCAHTHDPPSPLEGEAIFAGAPRDTLARSQRQTTRRRKSR
jgi:ribA/ribD-fused uncharacterized protein